MVSASDFNLFIEVMYWGAVVTFGVALGLMVLLLATRIQAISRRKHVAALVAVWGAVFTGEAPNRPRHVKMADGFTVLSLWNEFRRSTEHGPGPGVEHLTEIARVQQFDSLALVLVRHGDAGDRIIALKYIAYMEVAEALPQVKFLIRDDLPELALAAYRALIAIDRMELKSFAFAIARHDDWRLSTVEEILKEARIERNSRALIIAAEDASDEQMLRLLPFLTLCDPSSARPALREQLRFRKDPSVLAAALRALIPFALPLDRELVRSYLSHPVPLVRIAAIGAVVPIHTAQDRDDFVHLSTDRDPEVRYRAAQALLECFADDDQVENLRLEVGDRFAQDAISQVSAERSVQTIAQFVASETAVAEHDDLEAVGHIPMDALRAEA